MINSGTEVELTKTAQKLDNFKEEIISSIISKIHRTSEMEVSELKASIHPKPSCFRQFLFKLNPFFISLGMIMMVAKDLYQEDGVKLCQLSDKNVLIKGYDYNLYDLKIALSLMSHIMVLGFIQSFKSNQNTIAITLLTMLTKVSFMLSYIVLLFGVRFYEYNKTSLILGNDGKLINCFSTTDSNKNNQSVVISIMIFMGIQ